VKFLLSALLTAFALTGSAPAAEPYQLAAIPKGTTHEYWKAVQVGAMKAQCEPNAAGVAVNVIWKSPLKEDDREKQIQVVENFTGRHVSAIVISPPDQYLK